MTIREQTIRPATCTCELVELWDDADPPETRIFSLKSIIVRGVEHAAIVDASLYSAVKEEQSRVSKMQVIAESLGYPYQDIVDADGNIITAQQVAWAYTLGRTLEVSFLYNRPNLQRRRAFQDAIDLQVGLAKVVVL